MNKFYYTALFFIMISLSACDDPFSNKITEQKPPEIGRFAIFDTKLGTFMLDTVTGGSWRRVVIPNKKGEMITTYWSRESVFNDEISENNYVRTFPDRR